MSKISIKKCSCYYCGKGSYAEASWVVEVPNRIPLYRDDFESAVAYADREARRA